MKKLLHGLFAVAFLCVCQNSANAAQEIVHTVDFPKGDAAWSVKFEKAPPIGRSPKNAPPEVVSKVRRMKKIVIVRMGGLRHDVVTWSDGSTTEYWWPGPLVFFQDGASGRIYTRKVGNMEDQRYDDSLFTWVGPSTFGGMKPYEGKKCRYYTMEIPQPDGGKQVLRAWIDDKSLRPVAWTDGGIATVFSFDASLPSDPLVMPDQFQNELKRISAFSDFSKKTTPVATPSTPAATP